MSFLDALQNLTKNVGRGALDIFTLGGNELGHKFGGQGYANAMKIPETGLGANFEAGAVGGGAMQGLGMGGAGTMSPYASTSTPVMGQAGSTLGGGMGSPMNLGPSAMGSTGAAQGMAVPGSAPIPAWQQALKSMRGMPGSGGQQQQQPQAHKMQLEQIYKMFPSLRPGSQFGIGGM